MITYFCPACWKELNGDYIKCPHCEDGIKEYEKKGFEEKLMNALRHPERETVQRAVYILGKLKSVKATRPLVRLFGKTADNPFLKIEILKALKEIGGTEAPNFIKETADTDSGIVGRWAKKLVDQK